MVDGAVSVIGLGLMGSALAGALVDAGHATTVWNRTRGRAGGLRARVAADVAEAVAASPIVVVCVLDHRAVHDVLDAAGSAVAGRVVVNLTSGTPDQARGTAQRLTDLGAQPLDGKILAAPPAIGRGARLIYSGSPAAHDRARTVLDRFGTGSYLGPDAGRAALYDLAMLSVLYSTLAGFHHAAALLRTEHIPAAALAPMAAGLLAAVGADLADVARAVDSGDVRTEETTAAVHAMALHHLVDASRAQGIGVAVPAPIRDLLDTHVANGHGAESLAGLVELIAEDR